MSDGCKQTVDEESGQVCVSGFVEVNEGNEFSLVWATRRDKLPKKHLEVVAFKDDMEILSKVHWYAKHVAAPWDSGFRNNYESKAVVDNLVFGDKPAGQSTSSGRQKKNHHRRLELEAEPEGDGEFVRLFPRNLAFCTFEFKYRTRAQLSARGFKLFPLPFPVPPPAPVLRVAPCPGPSNVNAAPLGRSNAPSPRPAPTGAATEANLNSASFDFGSGDADDDDAKDVISLSSDTDSEVEKDELIEAQRLSAEAELKAAEAKHRLDQLAIAVAAKQMRREQEEADRLVAEAAEQIKTEVKEEPL